MNKHFTGIAAVCTAVAFATFGSVAPALAADNDLSITAVGNDTSVTVTVTNRSDQVIVCELFGVESGATVYPGGMDDSNTPTAFHSFQKEETSDPEFLPGERGVTFRDVPEGSYDVHYLCLDTPQKWITYRSMYAPPVYDRDPIRVTVGDKPPPPTGSCFGSICLP